MKCKDCDYKKFDKDSSGVNRYSCDNPNAVAEIGYRLICRTQRHHTELTIKTAPKWCPLNK